MDVLKDPAKIYNFPPHKRGDTVNGRVFQIKVNNEEPPFPIIDVKIFLKKNNKIIYKYDIPSGRIILNSAGVFTIPKHILDIPSGHYDYDIQIIYQNGQVKTYLKGTWVIFEDITK